MRDFISDAVKRAQQENERSAQTPRVLYKRWPRPLRVGLARAGKLLVSNHGTSYGPSASEFRRIPERDLPKIEAAEGAIREAMAKQDALLKRVWRRADPLTGDELAAMGAEDIRKA